MTISVSKVVAQINYKEGWVIDMGMCDVTCRTYIQWSFYGKCVKTGEVKRQPCRKWWLSAFMTESEIVQTALAAALQAEEHECREFFSYKGKRLFQPHISIYALMDACETEDAR